MNELKDHELLCSLLLDDVFILGSFFPTAVSMKQKGFVLWLLQVQIAQGIQYDLALRRFVGNICQEFCSTDGGRVMPSSHALFHGKGITSTWKQVVGMYYFMTTSCLLVVNL